ncbi:MAG: hypothetical protein FJZ66_05055 [Bacteroidetes bacterium]|nr:hypothetical protein [Bacteroidota bacterium]
MIRLFLMNRVGVLFLLPFVVALFQYLHWISGNMSSGVADFGFWGEFQISQPISYILSSIFLVINAVTLNYVYNSYEFLDRNSYLTSLLYIVAMSFYDAFYQFNYVICIHFLFCIMLVQFFEIRRQPDARKYWFNAFLFIGIASTLQPLLLFFYPFFIISILIFRTFSVREFIFSFLGFLIPFFYCFTYLWWFNIEQKIAFDRFTFESNFKDLLWVLLAYFVMIVVSYLNIRLRSQKFSVRLKKQILALWLYVLIGLVIGIMNYFWRNELNDFSLTILFLTCLLTYSFLHKTYGLLASGVLYFCLVYSMLKFFI